MSGRLVYDCERCDKLHPVINARDPKTLKMRNMVVDCPLTYAPDPARFKQEASAIPHIPSRINSKE